MLTIAGSRGRVDINRAGSINTSDGPGVSGEGWQQRIERPGGTQQLAEEITHTMGWTGETRLTPHTLTCLVIARVLAGRVFDDAPWDARGQYYDSSGMDDAFIAWPAPNPEIGGLPANQVWVITRIGDPVIWLWDGWAWTARGERLDLVGRYAAGARFDELVAEITQRRTGAHAPALPPPRSAADQPIGTWPGIS